LMSRGLTCIYEHIVYIYLLLDFAKGFTAHKNTQHAVIKHFGKSNLPMLF